MIVFVTGTDTEVGKTVATAALAAAYVASGRSAAALKPAQTGLLPGEPGDADEITRLSGVPAHELVRLPDPLAPDTAARLAGIPLPGLCDVRDEVLALEREHDVVLVEGAGGLLVNLGQHWNLLDLADVLDRRVEVVVVARAGLGTLNHSSLTVWAAQQRRLAVAGLIIGSWPEHPGLAEQQNLNDLPTHTGVPILGRIPQGAPSLPGAEFRRHAPDWLQLPPI